MQKYTRVDCGVYLKFMQRRYTPGRMTQQPQRVSVLNPYCPIFGRVYCNSRGVFVFLISSARSPSVSETQKRNTAVSQAFSYTLWQSLSLFDFTPPYSRLIRFVDVLITINSRSISSSISNISSGWRYQEKGPQQAFSRQVLAPDPRPRWQQVRPDSARRVPSCTGTCQRLVGRGVLQFLPTSNRAR